MLHCVEPKEMQELEMRMVTDGRVMAVELENHEGGSFSLGGKSFSHQVVDKLRSSFVSSLFWVNPFFLTIDKSN